MTPPDADSASHTSGQHGSHPGIDRPDGHDWPDNRAFPGWPEWPSYFPAVVAVCGSTRFRGEIIAAARALTLAGHIVLAPGVFGHDDDPGSEPLSDEQKQELDALHLRKIDLADWVYVVNPGGYLGESTRNEIAYAHRTGKIVRYLVSEDPAA